MTEELTYSLVVSGLDRDLDGINVQQVFGTIDIAQWMAQEGLETLSLDTTYEIPVTFTFGSQITIQEPLIIQVQFIAPQVA
jgi:hypothetical protein